MKFRSHALDMTQRILIDVLDASRAPDAHGIFLVDMTEVHAFRARFEKEHGVALTDLHVMIAALARTIAPDAQINGAFARRGYRALEPDSVDLGVSVATGRSVAPVVLLQRAERKTLRQIHDELKEGARLAVEAERRSRQQGPPRWHRVARLVPDSVRRAAIHALSSSQKIKRSKIGTIQVTCLALNDMEFFLPMHSGTGLLISIGSTMLRPMVVNGQVEARPSVYIGWHLDQRVITPLHAGRAFRRFKIVLLKPDRLLK